jgi:hypothetical protein
LWDINYSHSDFAKMSEITQESVAIEDTRSEFLIKKKKKTNTKEKEGENIVELFLGMWPKS